MPKIINFTTPPFTRGNAEEQIKQLHSWLFKTIEQLNVAFDNVGTGSTDGGQAQQMSADDIAALREDLRQLVVRTAGTLRGETEQAFAQAGLSGLAIRRGTAVGSAIAGGAYADISASWDELGSVPVVAAGLTAPSGAAAGGVSCWVVQGSITTTGCTIRIANNSGDTTAHAYGVMWMAIG